MSIVSAAHHALLQRLMCWDVMQRRNVSIRRELRGEELSDRYFSLDLATLGREAIRGLLNPGNKPASQLNPLAVFAGAPLPSSRRVPSSIVHVILLLVRGTIKLEKAIHNAP